VNDPSERLFPKEIGTLPRIFDFVAERMRALSIDPELEPWVDLVVEELFTNTVKYAPNGRSVAIGIDRDGEGLRIRVTDFDVEAFDITREAPPVDVTLPAEKRTPGGLGLYLIRSTADSVAYEYRDRNSTITVTKRLDG